MNQHRCHWCNRTYHTLNRCPTARFCLSAHRMAHHRAFKKWRDSRPAISDGSRIRASRTG